jgi:hypothetical protein
LHLLPPTYQVGAHLNELRSRNWSGRQDLHLRLPSSRLGCLLLTYVLKTGHADRSCTCLKSLCRRPPEAARPRREVWGDRLGLHQLQRGHGPRAIYFAFCHKLVPSTGLAPAWSCWDRLVLSQVCLLIPPRGHRNGVPYRNRTDLSRLKGAGSHQKPNGTWRSCGDLNSVSQA